MVHFPQQILLAYNLIYILLYTIKQELILFLLYPGDGQFTENFIDCLKLSHISQVLVCRCDHLLHKFVFCCEIIFSLLFYHLIFIIMNKIKPNLHLLLFNRLTNYQSIINTNHQINLMFRLKYRLQRVIVTIKYTIFATKSFNFHRHRLSY